MSSVLKKEKKDSLWLCTTHLKASVIERHCLGLNVIVSTKNGHGHQVLHHTLSNEFLNKVTFKERKPFIPRLKNDLCCFHTGTDS